jgi:hypothetical protein
LDLKKDKYYFMVQSIFRIAAKGKNRVRIISSDLMAFFSKAARGFFLRQTELDYGNALYNIAETRYIAAFDHYKIIGAY